MTRNLIEDRWAETLDRKFEAERRSSAELERKRRLAREAEIVALSFAGPDPEPRLKALKYAAHAKLAEISTVSKLPVKSAREAAEEVFKPTRPVLTLVREGVAA